MREEMLLDGFQAEYAERLVRGVVANRLELDTTLIALVQGYDYGRLLAVDRNVMRLAAYELIHEATIPPAVSLNEAIEIARKYSTEESGKFVNGVLAAVKDRSPKAQWDPDTAPPEFDETPEPDAELLGDPEPVEEVTVSEDSPEAKVAKRHGWVLRSDEDSGEG
jgi:N utilization substance protein B